MDCNQAEAAINEFKNMADKLMFKSRKCATCELNYYFCYPGRIPEICDRCGGVLADTSAEA